MGIRRYARKGIRLARNANPVMKKFIGKSNSKSAPEEGMRAAAAKRLVNKNQQAGSGQITFQTEEDPT